LSGNESIHDEAHYVDSNITFFENAEIVCIVDKYQPPLRRITYNNVLNVIRDLCCCKQTVHRVSESAFPYFLARPMGGVVADLVLQSAEF